MKLRYSLLFLLTFVFLGAHAKPQLNSGEVTLSWEEFKTLLEQIEALKKRTEDLKAELKPKKPQASPVAYTLTEANFVGEVKGLSARFEAQFSVQILHAGWVTIPFFPANMGIETLNIAQLTPVQQETFTETSTRGESSEEPLNPVATATSPVTHAYFVNHEEGYALLAQGPQKLSIEAVFYVPIQINDLTYELTFSPPSAVIHHVSLQIPEQDIQIVKMNQHSQRVSSEHTTLIETVLSEQEPFQLSWQVKKDTGLVRKSKAALHSLVSIDKSEIIVSNQIILKHLTHLNEVSVQVPLAVDILTLTSLDVARWLTEKQKKNQVIKLEGQVDADTPTKIDLVYRLPLANLPAEVSIPMLTLAGVDDVEGFLAIEALGNLEVVAQKAANGDAIATKNLPKTLWQQAQNPLLYSYQFAKAQFSPQLSIRKYEEIQTIVANIDQMAAVTHRTLEGKSITRIRYFIRNNDRQFLTLKLPKQSRIWQVFLDGKSIKPARKESGEILIPMKKSTSAGQELQSFTIEVGYISEVSKLSLKGEIINELPAADIPISYLKWRIYLPAYYQYAKFEGPLKQVKKFAQKTHSGPKVQIGVPAQGQLFLFEKHLVVEEMPYVRSQYGQFLGDDIFLSLQHYPQEGEFNESTEEQSYRRQVTPNKMIK